MTTPKVPEEDIIELTEIVEEGLIPDPDLNDFPMEQPVGAKSLDDELDELLAGDSQAPFSTSSPGSESPGNHMPAGPINQPDDNFEKKETNFDDDLGDDLGLDDIFDALQTDSPLDSPSALDALLDDGGVPLAAGQPDSQALHQEKKSGFDMAEQKDVPSLLDEEIWPQSSDILDSTTTSTISQADKVLTPDFDSDPIWPQPSIEQEFEPFWEQDVVDKQQSPKLPTPKQAQNQEIEEIYKRFLTELEARLETLPTKSDFKNLTQMLVTTQKRLLNLENISEPVATVTTEQVLAAIPSTADQLPLAQTLRSEILSEVDEKLRFFPPTEVIEDLLQQVDNAQERILALENKPDMVADISPSQILAALPQTPDQVPLAQALRQEILQEIEGKLQAHPTTDLVQKIEQQLVDAQNHFQEELMQNIDYKFNSFPAAHVEELSQSIKFIQETVVDLSEALTSSKDKQTNQWNDLEKEVNVLREILQRQEIELADLQKEIQKKNKEILELQNSNTQLQEYLSAPAQPAELDNRLEALKQELQEYIQAQIPTETAKILREEIENLVQDMSEEV